MKIRAAVARQPGKPLTIEELELEQPRESEVLVKVLAVGVCHTDIAAIDGHLPTPMPAVLGHEGSGIVVTVGSKVNNIHPGDRVVMTFDSCGTCPCCIADKPTYCHGFFPHNLLGGRVDGSSPLTKKEERITGNFFGQSSFATHALCHQRNVVKVPEDAPLELLGPLGCGVQTGAGAIINALSVNSGDSCVVFGVGSVGISAVMAAKIVGAKTIIAVDLQDSRLELAKTLGATDTINPSRENSTEKIMSITGHGVQFSLDTTGNVQVIRQAVESLTNTGTCGVLGVSPPGAEIAVDASHFMSGGRRLMGIVEGNSIPDQFIPFLLERFQQGNFPFDQMVKFYDFDQINQAIEDSRTGVAVKPIIRIQ